MLVLFGLNYQKCVSIYGSPQKTHGLSVIIVWAILNVLASFKNLWLTGARMGKDHCCQFPNLGVWLDELQMLCLVEILSKYSPDTCVFVFFCGDFFPPPDASFSKFDFFAGKVQFLNLVERHSSKRYFPVLNFCQCVC